MLEPLNWVVDASPDPKNQRLDAPSAPFRVKFRAGRDVPRKVRTVEDGAYQNCDEIAVSN